jgi:threonine dehydrogenase-like Zn-dependent dehydrogenase
MKATLMYGAGDVRIIDVPDPAIHAPADAIVRVVRAAICGSDLHPYLSTPATYQMGHEFLGIVENTGAEVTGLRRGDLVLSPFTYADNILIAL